MAYKRWLCARAHCFTQTAVMPCDAAQVADAGCTWAAIGTSAKQTADAITSPPWQLIEQPEVRQSAAVR